VLLSAIFAYRCPSLTLAFALAVSTLPREKRPASVRCSGMPVWVRASDAALTASLAPGCDS
jgi:hypothetical protein